MRSLRKLGRWLAVLLVILAVPALYIGVGCRADAQFAITDQPPLLSEAVRAELASLQNYKGIVTYSEGEEPNRKVIIDISKD